MVKVEWFDIDIYEYLEGLGQVDNIVLIVVGIDALFVIHVDVPDNTNDDFTELCTAEFVHRYLFIITILEFDCRQNCIIRCLV